MPYLTESNADRRTLRATSADGMLGFNAVLPFITATVLLFVNSVSAQAPPSNVSERTDYAALQIQPLASRLNQHDTEAAVALGNLDAIARIEKASKLRPLYDSMIETETVRIALRQSIRRAGQVSETTARVASKSPSSRRVQMTAYSDRQPKDNSSVITLLKRKRMSLAVDGEDQPAPSSVAIAREFQPLRISPPPAETAKALVKKPSTKIGLAERVADTGTASLANNRSTAKNTKTADAHVTAVKRNPFADRVVVVNVPGKSVIAPGDETQVVIKEAKQFPVSKSATTETPNQLATNSITDNAPTIDTQKKKTTSIKSDPIVATKQPLQNPASPASVSSNTESFSEPPVIASPEPQALASNTASTTENDPQPNASKAGTTPHPTSQSEDGNVDEHRTVNAEIGLAENSSDAAKTPKQNVASQPEATVAMQWPFQLSGASKTAPSEASKDVTLSVNDVDVRVVFEMLSKGYGMNILVAPDVDGTVTANVSGLSPEQTLRSVVRMCGLAAQEEDGVILVYPRDNQPLESRVLRRFPLDYARSEILEPAVQGLLSPIGSAYASQVDMIDNRKGQEAIVVIDTLDVVQQVERYIMEADQPPRQVMIEARVLEVQLKDDMEHGVNLQAFFGGDFRSGAFQITESIATSTNPFFFSEINGNDLYAGITMLETTTDAKTLATPRVMVVNGQNAKIQVGQQLGFAVLTVTQTSTVQDVRYLDTGVVLDVTPTISRDGKILMQVKPKVSSGEINPDTLLPEETTREVETSVMLSNHHGMIIGGLIQEEDRVTIKKLPWLGDVKHVGRFFQQRSTNRGRSEIIVSLIPHIVENGIEENCDCSDPMRDQDAWTRTNTPLFDGPLNRTCRPWEARLPDETSNGILFKDHLRRKNEKPYSKGCEPIKTDLSKGKLGLH